MTTLGSSPQKTRSPWQLLYGAAHALRARWYSSRRECLARPVISLGNLHWGGTGKTPITAALAIHFHQRGLSVAILTRGYRRSGRGVSVVSRGGGPIIGPWIGGDEPVLLAEKAAGAAVLVGKRRAAAGRKALEVLQPRPDLFLLDDGFSHLALARDVDLLVVPLEDPFGGGLLPPSGRLREPLASAARADAILVPGASKAEAASLAQAFSQYGFTGPGFPVQMVNPPPRLVSGGVLPEGTRALVVCGIARPARFVDSVEGAGLEIAESIFFRDHYAYPASSVQVIERRFHVARADVVLTTAKDRIKLVGRLTVPLAELDLEAHPDATFLSWLNRQVDALRRER